MIFPQPPWIEITTKLPCAVRCYYCPQDVLARSYQGEQVLTLDNFARALANVPKHVLIDFAGFAEPFGNPACADMMLYANDEGYRLAVNSTLTGMTDADAERISSIPFEFFYYHDVRMEGRRYPFMTDTGRVYQPESRAGNLFPECYRTWQGTCIKSPSHHINVMLPNGDVVLCCNDYALKHPMGNLFEMRYDELVREQDYELCHFCCSYSQGVLY